MKQMCRKMVLAAVILLLSDAYGVCQDVEHERGEGGRPPRGMMGGGRHNGGRPDKSNDTVLKAMLEETVSKFVQLEYQDEETGKAMAYNLFIPENYDANQSYPLIMFIGDASTAMKEVTEPLVQGYGGVIWATAAEQTKHPSFVLVPQYSTMTVSTGKVLSDEVEMTIRLLESVAGQYNIDKNRLYATGQSMGGMMSMYFNVAHHGLFAASFYAGCQWDTTTMQSFADDRFIYVVGGGDERASKGMADLKTVLEGVNARMSSAEWSARLPQEEQEANVKQLLSEGNPNNFIVFTKGSVLPEDGKGMEHMCSFDFVYKLEAARDWIFEQRLAE